MRISNASWLFMGLLGAVAASLQATQSRAPAGMVVRSKEYVVRQSPHAQEEFIGDVSYKHGTRNAQADWALLDRTLQLWHARGHLHGFDLLKNEDSVEVWGDAAQHNLRTKRGWLTGKDENTVVHFERHLSSASIQDNMRRGLTPAQVLHPAPTEPVDRGTARRLEWDGLASEVTAKGDFHMAGPEGEAWAEEANWNDKNAVLRLNGKTHIVRPDGEVWAREAQWDNKKNQARFQGDVHVLQTDGEGWAENAFYDQPVQTIYLTGRRPVTTYRDPKWNGAIQADQITGKKNDQRMLADGSAHGWIVFQDMSETVAPKKSAKKK